MCLGRRPIPIGAENARSTLQEAGKSAHSGPLHRRPTTHLRVAAHCSLFRASLSFFRELPLLTRPHLAQPLLSSADPVGNGVFLSPLGVTVAALQPCSGMRDVSKYRVRLAPGSIPAHADPCDDYINVGMASRALQVCITYATVDGSMPSLRACH